MKHLSGRSSDLFHAAVPGRFYVFKRDIVKAALYR